MNTEAMHSALADSQAGKLTFPQAVKILVEAGVESYFVDLVRAEDRFYLLSGESHIEKLPAPSGKVVENFDPPGLVAAIRAAQADTIRYPEFLNRIMAVGTVAYWTFLAGRKVIYFGRKGEFHVEEFARPKT